MNNNASAYFRQSHWGESRWWSWLSGLWFTIMASVFLGGILGAITFFYVGASNPEILSEYLKVTNEARAEQNTTQGQLLGLGFMGLSVLALISWAIWQMTRGSFRTILAGITALMMVFSIILLGIVFNLNNSPEANAAFMPLIASSPVAYALTLASFPAMLIGLFFAQKYIHSRSILSLHTGANRFDWARVIFAIGATWAVLGGFTFIMHVTGINPVKSTFDPSRFFGFAIATLIFIPLQSGTEEIVFRGYLNQALGHYLSNKWVVFIITSALFAALHLSNPEALAGAEEGSLTHLMVMSQYFMFGLILSIIVYFEGGLEAAIGVHAGNNMFAAMFVNYEGSVLPTPSLFMSTPNPDIDAPVGIIVLGLIAYILYRTRKEYAPADIPNAHPTKQEGNF